MTEATVGQPLNAAQVNQDITSMSLGFRQLCEQAVNLSQEVNGQGNGQAALEEAGYTSAAATQALAAIGYLNAFAGLWFGTGTQPTEFSYQNEMSQYDAGT